MRNVTSGTIYYYEEDMLGSSRAMVQAGQTSVCYDADFYPFGGERDITNTCTQHYKFEGKERDTETGNDDFGARYYTSRLGRWLSADWSSVPEAVPYANLTNPQTLNLYAMVSDNPETFADLDGHQCTYGPSGGITGCKSDAPTSSGPSTTGEGQKTGDGTDQSSTQQAESIFVLNVGAGAEIGAEAKVGPVSVGVSVSAGVDTDFTNGPSAEASLKVNGDVKAGGAGIESEAKLSVATLDESGLHVGLKPSATVSLNGETKTFGGGAKQDTNRDFIVSGTLKAGPVKVEAGINFTALKNRAVQAARDVVTLVQISRNLDFRGFVPRFSPSGP